MGAIDPIIGYSQKITELTSKIKQCDDDCNREPKAA